MISQDINLALLPSPNVIEQLDYESILAQHKADLVAIFPECEPLLSLESEPLVKLLRVSAWRELLLRQRVNEACRALLLPLATKEDLDNIGTTYLRTQRLLISAGDATATPPVPAVWESDADYLYRCTLAPSSYSVAGPSGAYEYFALSASAQVKNASPHSPTPDGSVDVYILAQTGDVAPTTTELAALLAIDNSVTINFSGVDGTPSADLLATVNAALQPTSIRPMCDKVSVEAATVTRYSINAVIFTYPGVPEGLAVCAAAAAAAAYAIEYHRIEFSIYLNGIKAALKAAGVSDVAIPLPLADIINGVGQAAYCVSIKVSYGGVKQ